MSVELRHDNDASHRHTDALIIGAGFAGLYNLHRLRDHLGLSVRVLEAAGGVGGTWYHNRYPGARCDSESHVYGFSFSQDLMQDWEWTEKFPGQEEILSYLQHVAERFDLERDIRFDTRVLAARYDEAQNIWDLRTEAGEIFTATYLVTCVGCLSAANVPDIAGLESFGGRWYHTGSWPAEGVDFAGQRVGLIGTGSTGIQAAPVIAETASHLTVFQRSPTYSVPARNAPLTPEFKAWVRANAAEIRRATHATPTGHPFDNSERKALGTPHEERLALYEKAWEAGGIIFRTTFGDLMSDMAANDTAAQFIRDKIKSIVKDPETANKLTDIDHPYAGKRPPIDTNYYETFNRDNVSLVDLRKAPIERVTPTGLRTADADHPLDILVFATGYDGITGPLMRLNITGRGGRKLVDAWKEGPRTYLGLQVEGFPNMFTVTGPGSPCVLTNMPVSIEQHGDWIADCIDYMRRHDIVRIEPEPAAVDWWQDQVATAASATLLSGVTTSWYLGTNVPGKPRAFMPYAGGLARYRAICADIAGKGYEGFALTSAQRERTRASAGAERGL